jgi:hypothetical protein
MQKWEYLSETFDHWKFAEDLEEVFGNDGWELVAILQPKPGEAFFIYYFKRPKS